LFILEQGELKEWMGINWALAQKPNFSMNSVNICKIATVIRDVW
jgi:hypothetical protein